MKIDFSVEERDKYNGRVTRYAHIIVDNIVDRCADSLKIIIETTVKEAMRSINDNL